MTANHVAYLGLGVLVAGLTLSCTRQVTILDSDDKILVVRDGSVEVFVHESKLKDKPQGDRKHEWSLKGDTVEILQGPVPGQACDTALASAVPFDSVDFKAGGVTFTAKNGTGNKLELEFPSPDYEFKWRTYRRQLAQAGSYLTDPLEEVVVKTGTSSKTYTRSEHQSLCVRFLKN